MIHLSEVAGDVFSPASRTAAQWRDAITLALNAVPQVKQYFVEMRFKPMPRYEQGGRYCFHEHGFDLFSFPSNARLMWSFASHRSPAPS